MAVYELYGGALWQGMQAFARTLTSGDLRVYLKSLPSVGKPPVVQDNAGIHIYQVFKSRRRALAQQGIFLYYPPAYGSELKEIKPVLPTGQHEIPKTQPCLEAGTTTRSSKGSTPRRRSSAQNVIKQLRQVA